jgi:hypothetical protein
MQTPRPCVWEPVQQKTISNVTNSVVQLISPMTKFKPSCQSILSKEEISKQCGKMLLTSHLTSSKLPRLGNSDHRRQITNYLHTAFTTAISTANCMACGNNLHSSDLTLRIIYQTVVSVTLLVSQEVFTGTRPYFKKLQ